jgi:GDP-4-dehydro-6-deoxy-D-mannose reductase
MGTVGGGVARSRVAHLQDAEREGGRSMRLVTYTTGYGARLGAVDGDHVVDVNAAYAALIARGQPGEVYNVASGKGVSLQELFNRLASIVGVKAIPEPDPEFMRPADIPVLVGESAKLRAATGWAPRLPFDQTLRDLVDAQAD